MGEGVRGKTKYMIVLTDSSHPQMDWTKFGGGGSRKPFWSICSYKINLTKVFFLETKLEMPKEREIFNTIKVWVEGCSDKLGKAPVLYKIITTNRKWILNFELWKYSPNKQRYPRYKILPESSLTRMRPNVLEHDTSNTAHKLTTWYERTTNTAGWPQNRRAKPRKPSGN